MRPIEAVATLLSLSVVPMGPVSGLRHTRTKGRPRGSSSGQRCQAVLGCCKVVIACEKCSTLHPPKKVAPAAVATLECSFGSGLGPWAAASAWGGEAEGRACTNEEGMGDSDCRVRQSCLQYLEAGKGRENRFALCSPV